MARDILTDKQWKRLRRALPPEKPKTGRPAKDHRLVVNGILWILRTGAPWRDLPQEYGPWQTCSRRFYRWVQAGVWNRVPAELQCQADQEDNLDWSLHHVDGTMIRAHQHAAGGQIRGPQQRTLTKPWDVVTAGSAPRATFAPKGKASRSPS